MAKRQALEINDSSDINELTTGVELEDDDDLGVALPPSVTDVPVINWVIDAADHGKRLDVVLSKAVPQYSRNHLQSLIARGLVRLADQVAQQASRKVLAGQTVQAVLEPTAEARAFTPESMDIPIVFEDDHILVVNKPAGWVVHPAAGHWSGTLLNGLLAHHAPLAHVPRAGIVHRLDKDTSGVMVVGKTVAAATALTRLIAERLVHRHYCALVWGQPPDDLHIDVPVGRDPVSRIRMAVTPSGKPAQTDVKLQACLQWEDEAGVKRTVSAVRCRLHTGRTHQIRVHLSHRRWPLLADAVYGGAPALGMQRQALHAETLAFTHPILGQDLTFHAPLPDDMAQAWARVVAA